MRRLEQVLDVALCRLEAAHESGVDIGEGLLSVEHLELVNLCVLLHICRECSTPFMDIAIEADSLGNMRSQRSDQAFIICKDRLSAECRLKSASFLPELSGGSVKLLVSHRYAKSNQISLNN